MMEDITPKNLAIAFASLVVAATLTTVFNVGPISWDTPVNECQIEGDGNPTAEEFKSCIEPN